MKIASWSGAILLLAFLATGCDSAPTEPNVQVEEIDIGGVWDFTDVLIVSEEVTVCRDTGSVRFEQSGNTFTGRGGQAGTCSSLISRYPSDRTLEIVDGEISDSTIAFKVLDVCGCGFGDCQDAVFVGTVEPDGSIVGSSACSVSFDGHWEASPPASVASIEFALDSIEMVVEEAVPMEPRLYSDAGARLFQRQVSWSTSDGHVLQLSDSAWIRALDVGTATVTAEIEGLTSQYRVRTRHVAFMSVEAGVYHTCGIESHGTVFCWGANDAGQSGPAPSLTPCPGVRCRPAPSEVPAAVSFNLVSPGFLNTCALSPNGSAHCWGINGVGQLGVDVSMLWSPIPVEVSGGYMFASLRTGTNHTCAITAAGVAHCWGYNGRSQLGSAGPEYSSAPLLVSGGLTYGVVVTGQEHSCGIGADDRGYCWGWNYYGQLGVDSVLVASLPQPVSGGITFASIESGQQHSCGLTAAGVAYCWGRDREKQLGAAPGEFRDLQITPVPVLGGLTFQSISGGGFHTCGLTPDGAAYCWGRGEVGQLGTGSDSDSPVPVPVVGGLLFQSISAGYKHTCGQATDGLVYCWGSNFNGQLGTQTADRNRPTRVLGQPH
jgi:alpha-tubulin suppressor-like RCC1 family protein